MKDASFFLFTYDPFTKIKYNLKNMFVYFVVNLTQHAAVEWKTF